MDPEQIVQMELVEHQEQPQPDEENLGSTKASPKRSKKECCEGRYGVVVASVIFFLILAGGVIILAIRSNFVDVSASSQTESLPSLVKFASVDEAGGGKVIIKSSESLIESSTTFYYVTVEDFSIENLPNVVNPEDVDLWLTETSTPTIEDLNKDTTVVFENITTVAFPLQLPVSASPDRLNGVLFVEDSRVITQASFIDESSSSISLPPVLTSSLSGSYSIGGTITIDYITQIIDGDIQTLPRLQLDIPEFSGAPGPYLYLSKTPYSQTRNRDWLTDDDILVPIDQGSGSFSIKGRFEQLLDEVELIDIEDYANGSWIVWCDPFYVWIGGGDISIVE